MHSIFSAESLSHLQLQVPFRSCHGKEHLADFLGCHSHLERGNNQEHHACKTSPELERTFLRSLDVLSGLPLPAAGTLSAVQTALWGGKSAQAASRWPCGSTEFGCRPELRSKSLLKGTVTWAHTRKKRHLQKIVICLRKGKCKFAF